MSHIRAKFESIDFDCLLNINEQIVPHFVLEFYSQLTFDYNSTSHFVVNFVIQSKSFSLTLEEFGQILKIPFKGQVSHTDMWSLDYLSISVPSKGRYKTTPSSPSVVKSFIQIPRQGQVTHTNKTSDTQPLRHPEGHKKPQGAKGKDKGKNKFSYAPKPKIPLPPKREHPANNSVYHHCKEVGHWKRNCPSYQAELKKRKIASIASTSERRKLKHRALSLYVGNEMRTAVEAIGSFDLILPSGLIIVLDNCHFAPSITKDMHNLYPNVSSMFNVSNKRFKYSLDSSCLWNCCLGHINKKRMDKLQRDGVLPLTHDESLKK
ncbi:pentatricopeptide repeat-containing protein [Tanacetum coccineum]